MTLTINIDEKKLQALRAKAEREGKSLEKLFEKYVDSILEEGNVSVQNDVNSTSEKIELQEESDKFLQNESKKFEGKSPFEIITELTKNIKTPSDFDEKQDYREHIIRKHA